LIQLRLKFEVEFVTQLSTEAMIVGLFDMWRGWR
jgi:hypothetical protein